MPSKERFIELKFNKPFLIKEILALIIAKKDRGLQKIGDILQDEVNRILKKDDNSLRKVTTMLQKEIDTVNAQSNGPDMDKLIRVFIKYLEKENVPQLYIDRVSKIHHEIDYDPDINTKDLVITGYKITTNISECLDTGIPCTSGETSPPNWHCIDGTWHICNGESD